jgi:hypothetical protein
MKRSDYCEHIGLLLVLLNRLVCWVVMLLVAKEYVIQQGALRWQKGTCYLKRFGMPKFALQLPCLFYWR